MLSHAFKLVPGLLLLAMLLIIFLAPSFSLATLEPFDAFLFQTAGYATLIIAVVGMVLSLFVPMAYCRYGCPTGAFLDYLRLSGRHDKFNVRDWFALLLLGVAINLWYWV